MPNCGWYLLSMTNRMLYCNDTHPLLMKCFKPFLGCIRHIRDVSGSVCLPLMGLIVTITTEVGSQIAHKIQGFVYHLSMANEMIFYNEGHSLIMKCFVTFLRYMRQLGGAANNIGKAFMHLNVPFYTEVVLQIASKILDFCHPLVVWIMWWCPEIRDTHCLWSVSNPSLDA